MKLRLSIRMGIRILCLRRIKVVGVCFQFFFPFSFSSSFSVPSSQISHFTLVSRYFVEFFQIYMSLELHDVHEKLEM